MTMLETPRRVVLAGALALGAGPAAAQRGDAILRAEPTPCPARPGDLFGVTIEGPTEAGTILVFGQAFRPGDLPRDRVLAARLADGRAILTQTDVTTRHPDGSARLAAVALAAPALGPGRKLGLLLAAVPEPPAAAPLPSPAGRTAVLEIASVSGDAPFRLDLLAGFSDRPAWQVGRLVHERRVSAAVPAAIVGGATSVRVVADLALRADGSLWVDAWMRNDIAMQPGGGAAIYGMRLLLDGRQALSIARLVQPLTTGWGRRVGAGPAGLLSEPAPVRTDPAYLAAAGAVLPYDLGLGVAESVLARLGAATEAAVWGTVLGPRGITQYMPATGGREDIGPTTLAQAAWLVSGDRRAARYAIGQAEAAGSIPWHLWDPNGGAVGRGGWLDAVRWPRLWSDGRGGRPPGGLAQPIPTTTGWETDTAHQPNLSYVPYLLTARRAMLDELQAQAAWSVMACWPDPQARGTSTRIERGEGANLVRGQQVRAAAWSLRQVEEAAWASPDADRSGAYFAAVAAGNWAWVRAQTAGWQRDQGEAHGWIAGEYREAWALPPWQQDHFAAVAAAAARRGSADAAAVLGWMANFLIGRFRAEAQGFPRHDGAAYNIAVADPASPARLLRSWGEIGAMTRARNLSNGTAWRQSEGNYPQLALMTLALLAETGHAEAREAWRWLAGAGAPFTRAEDFAKDPTSSVTPAGLSRGSGGAGCVAGR